MAGGGSRKVLILAFLANLGIAIAKLVAALFTRSGAMLAESIHSFADAGNQVLLLVGEARSDLPPDRRHPLGYGREAYFWAMLVAVILFVLGGAYSLYEGAHKLAHPTEIRHVGWALGVLAFGMVLEGISLLAAWREVGRVRAGRPFWVWARRTGRVNLLTVTFEDFAAMFGLVIAFVAILLSHLLSAPRIDAIGTLVLGLLLLGVAVFLANQVRRLIVGFSAGDEVRDEMIAAWEEAGFEVMDLAAVWGGPEELMVLARVLPRDAECGARELIERINRVERTISARWPQVTVHFVEPELLGARGRPQP